MVEAGPEGGQDAGDVTEVDVVGLGGVPRGFSAALPYAREVTRSLNLGTPVLAYAPSAEISRTLLAGLQSLLSGAGRAASGTDAASAAPGHRSWLSRRLRPPSVVARAGSVR